MRLIHVVPSYLPAVRYGGPIFAVHGLCAALAARGHAVDVFTTSVDGPDDSPVPHGVPVPMDGVTVRYFASRIGRRLYWAPALARALRHEIADAAIVHLHSVFLWPTSAAARLARRWNIPYVMSPRGMLVKDLVARRSSTAKNLWISLIEKRNLEGAAAVHVTSGTEASELAAFGFRLGHVATIPNGVAEIALPVARSPAADVARLAEMRPLMLYFGRLSWKKGLERLLRAFALTGTGKLAIVGTDDEGLAPRLRRLAGELGITDRVHIVPRTVTGEEKEFVFAAANALVLASLSENFGNVVIEAMQRGLAVIGTRGVGAAETILAARGGLVVEANEPRLAQAMETLALDANFATELGKAGQIYVCAHCRWPVIAEQMETLYRSVLAQRDAVQSFAVGARHA